MTVPVNILVTTGPNAPPFIGSLVNAASQTSGAIAPGEIITIYGYAVGSPRAIGFALDLSGNVTTDHGGAEVLFDGKPAPLLYTSPDQTNAIVPYEVAAKTATNVEVVYNGVVSAAWGIPVAPAAPSIFTLDGSGLGQGAILNQDNSVNGPSNPAARGSVIQIYATGEGQTSPPSLTGSVTKSDLKTPVLPVRVSIAGRDASVQFAGSAPDSVAGLLQVNALLPVDVTPGPAVPISLTIGKAQSPNGVTIAVK